MANETTVKESETTVSDVDSTDRDGPGPSHRNDGYMGWFTSSALRFGLGIVGLFLLLAALGQLSGIDILGETANILGTEVGRWLLVAIVAIALIGVAVYGFRGRAD